eukprot:5743460-Pyramimonas_sp.AAC.1
MTTVLQQVTSETSAQDERLATMGEAISSLTSDQASEKQRPSGTPSSWFTRPNGEQAGTQPGLSSIATSPTGGASPPPIAGTPPAHRRYPPSPTPPP